MDFQREYFENKDSWEIERFGERELERIRSTAGWVPDDVRSVLDIGCGNGLFVQHLGSEGGRFERICACDRSLAALEHVSTEKVQCSVDTLPFADREFDLVTALEVVEHLPLHVYQRALSELARVAGKYVLITVPCAQRLEESLIECPGCKSRFNPSYHVRSFSEGDLRGLLDAHGFSCVAVDRMGRKSEKRFVGFLRSRRRARAGTLATDVLCPVCGYTIVGKAKPGGAPKKPTTAQRSLSSFWPKKWKSLWLLGLYQRNGVVPVAAHNSLPSSATSK